MCEGKDHRGFGQLLSRLDQLIVWDPSRPCQLSVFRNAQGVLCHAHHANLIPVLLLVSAVGKDGRLITVSTSLATSNDCVMYSRIFGNKPFIQRDFLEPKNQSLKIQILIVYTVLRLLLYRLEVKALSYFLFLG